MTSHHSSLPAFFSGTGDLGVREGDSAGLVFEGLEVLCQTSELAAIGPSHRGRGCQFGDARFDDNSPDMLAHLDSGARIEKVLADITTLDLPPRRWPVVVLASRLINDGLGASFLAAAGHHLEQGGFVLVERREPGWIATVEASSAERNGVTMAIRDISRPAPGTLRATMVYDVNQHRYEQPFTAHEVNDQCLAEMAAAAGLKLDAVLDDRGTLVRLIHR